MTDPGVPNSNPYEPMLPVDDVAPTALQNMGDKFWMNFRFLTVGVFAASIAIVLTFSWLSSFGVLGAGITIIAGYRGFLAKGIVDEHPQLQSELFRKTVPLFFMECFAIGLAGLIGGLVAFVGTCYPTSAFLILSASQSSNGGSSIFSVIPVISLLCLLMTLWLLRKFLLFTLPKASNNEPLDDDSPPS